MLAVAGRDPDMLGMKLMRRRDVNSFDLRIVTQFLDARICGGAMFGSEPATRFRAYISTRNDRDFRIRKRRRHQHESAAKARHAETQRADRRLGGRSWCR